MEEDKYYTPEIEEFHVGFECELKNSSDKPSEWESFIIEGVDDASISGYSMDWSFYDTRNAILEKRIRVKYLDKKDIEILGWKSAPINKNDDEEFFEKEGMKNWIMLLYKDNWKFIFRPNQECIIKYVKSNYNERHFEGTIKNKSELKRLMKQLNIE